MTMKNLNSVLDSKNIKLLQEAEEEEDEEEYIVSLPGLTFIAS